jgi:hypothetical protein
MTDEKNKVENTFSKKIGKTNYKVAVHFSETSDETITDKINRLIQKECEDMVTKKTNKFLNYLDKSYQRIHVKIVYLLNYQPILFIQMQICQDLESLLGR